MKPNALQTLIEATSRMLRVAIAGVLTLSACGCFPFPRPARPEILALYEKARVQYQRGNFDAALHDYLRILEMGRLSPALLFNIGNCYYRRGDLPRAILFYRWASYLAPSDPDIQANLQFVLSRCSAEPPPADRLPIRLLRRISLLQWGAILVAAYWALCFAGALYLISQRKSALLRFAISTLAALLLLAAAGMAAWSPLFRHPEAVVIAPNTQVNYAPLPRSTTRFYLPQGTIVRLIREQSGWSRISAGSHGVGWVRSDRIIPIPPVFPRSLHSLYPP